MKTNVVVNPDVISDDEVALRLAQMDVNNEGNGTWYKI